MSALRKVQLAAYALALALFAADQLVKHYVTQVLGIDRYGDSMEVIGIFNLTYVRNYGVSLGMFEASSPEMRWGLVAVTALIAIFVAIWIWREKLAGDIWGLSLILGGALGNIVDRYSLGYVIDYADLHFGDFRPFLVFNLADAAITIGVVIILVRSFLVRDKGDTSSEAAPAAES